MAVTIKDVAKESGVSIATVSKVMNNSASISEETSERVKKIIDRLEYHPNQRARNFAKQSTRTILFASEFSRNSAYDNPHLFEIVIGLQKTIAEKRYALNIMSVKKDDSPAVLGSMITQKSIDGIVLHISVVTRELEKIILENNFPHIVIGCPEFKTKLCWIDNNNMLSGEMATEYLLNRGYKKIGFIGGRSNDLGSQLRLQGYKNVLKQRNIVIRPEYVELGDSNIENGYNMMNRMMAVDERPHAIICANNYLAYGAINAAHDAGYDFPRDFGLITFDAHPFSNITKPRMTVIDIDMYDMGKQVGETIMKKIKTPNLQIQSYAMISNLIVNGT